MEEKMEEEEEEEEEKEGQEKEQGEEEGMKPTKTPHSDVFQSYEGRVPIHKLVLRILLLYRGSN